MRNDPNRLPSDDQAGPEAQAYWRAYRLVKALRGWYIHLAVYLCVNAFLWLRYFFLPAQNWSRHHLDGGWPWPLATTLAWGLALSLHGLSVRFRLSGRGREWEERKIREFMGRD
ncbi:2TM domain-containing protein [Cupriavidus basilensis]|uniref:2TM domain-containing protein n=1 Tax=Cupriavidus basilensis TaxID=68895 RepID=A0ABT6AG23_9BURK|nr:2TM domain-containing protein [Cupriavidus basilensis]MDF3831545.1 2TM domain-containing protein [Cupriavidus basilensis]